MVWSNGALYSGTTVLSLALRSFDYKVLQYNMSNGIELFTV